MPGAVYPKQVGAELATSRAARKRVVKNSLVMLLLVGSLLMSSGDLGWTMAWVYIGVVLICQVATTLVLLKNSPELLAERARIQDGSKDWDKPLAMLVAFGPLVILIVAGFDHRFIWSSPIAVTLQVIGLVIVVIGNLLGAWAMLSNRFFSAVVRIQTERGHRVATEGPYRFVRHPGYVGTLLFFLATPLALGTWWALLPALPLASILVMRTALEDRTLRAELDGYRDYASKVRYRLVPGVW